MGLLPKFKNMLAYIDQNVDGINTDYSERHLSAGTLFEVASCHAKGVCTLLEEHLYASAAALERILFESFIRASWFLHCASDEAVNIFLTKDKIQHTFGELLTEVEGKLNWPGALSKIKSDIWKAMNSFTHGGYMQVVRHYDGSSIMPTYTPEEIDEMVKFSAMIAFLTYSQIIGMSNNREKDKTLEDLYDQVKWCVGN